TRMPDDDTHFDQPRKTYVMRTEEKFVRANAKPGQNAPGEQNDVRAWREDQRVIENQAGTDDLTAPPKYLYRRRRDFVILLLLGNGFFGGMMFLNPQNPFVLMFGLAGIILSSVGGYWIIYHLMQKY
ncbi:MAG: hypothetical protein ACKVI3_20795, partial [Verrucomicrobiia bacterium]